MKIFYVLLIVLLVQAAFAKDKKKDKKKDKGKKHQVQYQCPPCPPQSVTVLRSVTACEQENRRIRCPAGSAIRVVEAFYGRKNGYTCPRASGNLGSTNCSAQNVLSNLKARCDQRAECDLVNFVNWFADPCSDTYKYLEVDYVCEARRSG